MEDKKQPLENKLNSLIKISIIIGILLISFSVSYYFVYFLPQQEKIKANIIKQKEEEIKEIEVSRQANLELCLEMAASDNRRLQKANGKGPMLTMPLELANALDKRYKDARDDCYKKYPSAR